jgi:hypothetical protein
VVGACESAYGCAYYNTVSWRNDTTPLPMENRPRAIFERLFGDAGSTDPKARLALRQDDRSILDAVTQDVRRLRGKLGGADRGKIDQYLEAVRASAPQPAGRRATTACRRRRPSASRRSLSDYYKWMADLMVPWQDQHDASAHSRSATRWRPAYPEVTRDAHHSVT